MATGKRNVSSKGGRKSAEEFMSRRLGSKIGPKGKLDFTKVVDIAFNVAIES